VIKLQTGVSGKGSSHYDDLLGTEERKRNARDRHPLGPKPRLPRKRDLRGFGNAPQLTSYISIS
jgi:hypothetical protein